MQTKEDQRLDGARERALYLLEELMRRRIQMSDRPKLRTLLYELISEAPVTGEVASPETRYEIADFMASKFPNDLSGLSE